MKAFRNFDVYVLLPMPRLIYRYLRQKDGTRARRLERHFVTGTRSLDEALRTAKGIKRTFNCPTWIADADTERATWKPEDRS